MSSTFQSQLIQASVTVKWIQGEKRQCQLIIRPQVDLGRLQLAQHSGKYCLSSTSCYTPWTLSDVTDQLDASERLPHQYHFPPRYPSTLRARHETEEGKA